jgi:hypothetical protein
MINMSFKYNTTEQAKWTNTQQSFFVFFALYFLLQCVPWHWKFFADFFGINWGHLRYGDIFLLAHYTPDFFGAQQSYLNWLVIAVLALAGVFVWKYLIRNKTVDYDKLYYWVRVIVRYRLAIGVIAYGFIKLYPLQSPFPSLSNLNTNYGDFTRWKLFSLSLGIVPSYQSFLGAVEIATGLLLFWRRTASIGAFFVIIFTGNVFMSNLAYEGGEHVYSLYLISLAIFVLAYDLQRLISLLVLQKPTNPNRFKQHFRSANALYLKWFFKSAFILLFVVVYGFTVKTGAERDPYKVPVSGALQGSEGVYNVSEFNLNNDSIPYSKTDPLRWQDVVFEKWGTISIRSSRVVIIDSTNTEQFGKADDEKTYELEGTGGRHYYSYTIDSARNVLVLKNKNRHYKDEQLLLHYARPDSNTIILSGYMNAQDSVFVVLNKIKKKYLLKEVARQGRQKPLKL